MVFKTRGRSSIPPEVPSHLSVVVVNQEPLALILLSSDARRPVARCGHEHRILRLSYKKPIDTEGWKRDPLARPLGLKPPSLPHGVT